jgi:hypothetical protein
MTGEIVSNIPAMNEWIQLLRDWGWYIFVLAVLWIVWR